MAVKPAPGRGVLFYAGSAGLLTMMIVESIAVIGRHTGAPLTGALEIVQVAVVPAACAAMLIATLHGTHATVHLLTTRLPPAARRRIVRAGSILAGVFFAMLCAGAGWLAIEYWNAFEQTEVLHLPFRPLRLLVVLAAGALALASWLNALARGGEE